jgi:hypothetical protein
VHEQPAPDPYPQGEHIFRHLWLQEEELNKEQRFGYRIQHQPAFERIAQDPRQEDSNEHHRGYVTRTNQRTRGLTNAIIHDTSKLNTSRIPAYIKTGARYRKLAMTKATTETPMTIKLISRAEDSPYVR